MFKWFASRYGTCVTRALPLLQVRTDIHPRLFIAAPPYQTKRAAQVIFHDLSSLHDRCSYYEIEFTCVHRHLSRTELDEEVQNQLTIT